MSVDPLRIAIAILCHVSMVRSSSNTSRLFRDIFVNYNKEIRPDCPGNAPTEVKIGLEVRQILDVNEAEQTLTVSVWIQMEWSDCQLKWDPIKYGRRSVINIPYGRIWVPDITVFNDAGHGLPGIGDHHAIIMRDGIVNYFFPTTIKIRCRIDVTFFPFDTQTCNLFFASWSYDGFHLNITNSTSEVELSSYLPNSEWDLVGVPVERHEIYYACCAEPFPDVTFYVKLKRKPMFFVYSIIFPCLLITLTALLGFLLPPESGERVTLEVTMLLCLSIFMVVVTQVLPPTAANFTVSGIYFCVLMMLTTLSTVLSILVINVHFRGQIGHRVPQWMRSVCLESLARLLWVTVTGSGDSSADKQRYGTSIMAHPVEKRDTSSHPDGETAEQSSVTLDSYQQKDAKNEACQVKKEWKMVAAVLDRLFFLILIFLFVLGTVVPMVLMVYGETIYNIDRSNPL